MLLRRSVGRAFVLYFSLYTYIIMMRASPAGRPSMAAQLTRVNTTFSTTGKRGRARGESAVTSVPCLHWLTHFGIDSARARRTYGLARTRLPQVRQPARRSAPPCPRKPAGRSLARNGGGVVGGSHGENVVQRLMSPTR